MKRARIICLIVGLLGLAALPPDATADHKSKHNSSHPEQYTLEFIPTKNALPGVQGTMTIKVVNGETIVHFRLRNAYPNTVYTIWIVYNKLKWPLPTAPGSVPADHPCFNLPPGEVCKFPPEALGVAVPSQLKRPLADGMGLDPGLTFVTDNQGNGEKRVKLDYNLLGLGEAAAPGNEDGPPLANKNFSTQCVPGPPNSDGSCPNSNGNKKINVASTWLRKFIIDFKTPDDRRDNCANYEPAYDGSIVPRDLTSGTYDLVAAFMDSRYWQCIDPATLRDPNNPWSGLPRVYRYKFNHFRLAPHPDFLTHGTFGGNFLDHFIEMVGLRCDTLKNGVLGQGLTPPPADCLQ